MPSHDIIVAGASAGGVEALARLVGGLPAQLPAALFVVVHHPPDSPSALPTILSRHGPLPAAHAADGESIHPGRIYVAPPDRHLVIQGHHVHLSRGPRENRSRPAIDTLFRSAAHAYGRRVVGVLLTGLLDDGTAGLLAVKRHGGVAVVQDPADALYGEMPRSAVDYVPVDHVLPLSAIAPLLVQLAGEQALAAGRGSATAGGEEGPGGGQNEPDPGAIPGRPSSFSCPECGGVLVELDDGKLFLYRCRVGHIYAPASLVAEQAATVEQTLWATLRALEERAALARHLAARARERGHLFSAASFARRAEEAERRARLIQKALQQGEADIPPTGGAGGEGGQGPAADLDPGPPPDDPGCGSGG